jgi:hypothetical protein
VTTTTEEEDDNTAEGFRGELGPYVEDSVGNLAQHISFIVDRIMWALDDYEDHERTTGYQVEVLRIVHRYLMNAMFTIEKCSPDCDHNEFASHEHVLLPELGFWVDRGLEDLVRALWANGAATSNSCIGGEDADGYDEEGYVAFAGRGAAIRGAEILQRSLEWDRDQTHGVIRFPAGDLAQLTRLAQSFGEPAPTRPVK